MKTNFKRIKNLIAKLEKKEKELAAYSAKIARLESEIKEIQNELSTLLKTNDEQTDSFASYSA